MNRDYVQAVVNEVSAWEGVSSAPHRFGGVEFNLTRPNITEVGHIHSSGMVDIPFTKAIRDQLIRENRASEHHLLKESGWISFYLRQESDVQAAVELYRISYLHKRLRKERAQADEFARQIAALDLSDDLRRILLPERQGE